MHRPFTILIPKSISEIIDTIGSMILFSPTFQDLTGYFPGRNIENAFFELNEGLRLMRGQLGEELAIKLRAMSDQAREHFESDQDKTNGGTLKGREVLMEMEELIRRRPRKRRARVVR